ncbi:hypothetical protein BU23DRAFT_573688 [Bimuria novae-zelandiae CBS 107.79]|uniref:Uncharacterized protein n=1 Tax=Bimuria novae-zelandiae CBS 107.79 TaxID=1447943 RepID=A0A6A5UQA1_9PLEO|nr:hypothetical protein BU23DRAFT_573688 [Bimuria novae-zelandiae CBS 107.79]
MSAATRSTLPTTQDLSPSCVFHIRGTTSPLPAPTNPATPSNGFALDPPSTTPLPAETNAEWLINYRALLDRLRAQRTTSPAHIAALYAICIDRIAAVVQYLEKRDADAAWAETRPYLRFSAEEDREMGAHAKFMLGVDAQKIWVMDALVGEEEGLDRGGGESEVMQRWRDAVCKMYARCSGTLRSEIDVSALAGTSGDEARSLEFSKRLVGGAVGKSMSIVLQLKPYGSWRYSVSCTPEGDVELEDTKRQMNMASMIIEENLLDWKSVESEDGQDSEIEDG